MSNANANATPLRHFNIQLSHISLKPARAFVAPVPLILLHFMILLCYFPFLFHHMLTSLLIVLSVPLCPALPDA